MPVRSLRFPPAIVLLATIIASPILGGCVGDGTQTGLQPPFSPEEALKTFEIEDGFRIELVAAEPMVSDPVAMEVDEYGRFYVVEMHGYPMDAEGSGIVKMLRDNDGDGRPDESVVFAEGLTLPTGIMRWKQGVLVTDAPGVLYLEDSDGDGRADVRDTLLTGFALSNPQHNLNSPVYGLDNWIYLAHEPVVRTTQFEEEFGDPGSEIRFPDRPDAPRLPVNANGRSVRFRPDTYQLEALASRTQFGQTFDTWGRRFLVGNAAHVIHEVIQAQYLERNPNLIVASATRTIPDHGGAAEVFPITQKPEHQLLTDIGVFTSACGITCYLGDAFPSDYHEAMFVAEPVHNLVHVDRIFEAGPTFVASRMQEGREFLASTDSWFRPVNFYVGPDGALYVLDYYRQIIEHPEWMSDEVIESGDLYNGSDQGRIYRITPRGAASFSWVDNIEIGEAGDEALVEALESPNIWWRRTAQRMLIDRRSTASTPALTRLARESESAPARLHALWTLEGLGRLDASLIESALNDQEAGVRENAIKLAELHLEEAPLLAERLTEMAEDPAPRVRFQLLNSLGYVDTERAAAVRQKLLFDSMDDEWMQIAALSASSAQEPQLLSRAVSQLTGEETEGRTTFFRRINAMIGARNMSEEIREVVRLVVQNDRPEADWWRAASLEGLAEGMHRAEVPTRTSRAEQEMLLELFWSTNSAPVRRSAMALLEVVKMPAGSSSTAALQRALTVAGDRKADAELRADAIRLLALGDVEAYTDVYRRAIDPQEPAPVQKAAVRALSDVEGDEVATFVISRWSTITPEIRDEAIGVFVDEPGRVRLLLDAIEDKTVQPSSIGWRRTVRLMLNRDMELRERARALLSDQPGEREEVVERYEPALAMSGDFDRGEDVFARVCAACHQIGGIRGTAFGPDLGPVKNRRAEALIADILIPNKSIADGFEQWIIERKDGTTVQGVIPSETPTTVTLRNAAGEETTLPRSDIESMMASNVSAMPAGLENQIDLQQMSDLVVYLQRRK